jgi:hypothetical protein
MQQRQDIIPLGGMNTDDDPRHFEPGDYLEARNLRIGSPQDQGSGGLVETLRSTVTTALPIPGGGFIADSLTSSHLGVALDEENDFAYILSTMTPFAGTLSGLQFVITKHDLTSNTLKTIFSQSATLWGIVPYRGNYFAFYNPRIVDGKLIITDNVNNIRQFDVSRLENTYDAGITEIVHIWNAEAQDAGFYLVGDFAYWLDRVYKVIASLAFAPLVPPNDPSVAIYWNDVGAVVDLYLHVDDVQGFTLAAPPSLIAASVAYGSDADRKINQLKGRTWQFSYRYVYLDWRRSTFAPPSLVPPPSQEEDNEGVENPDVTFNNFIQVGYNTGSEEVREIEFVVRSSDDPATWFLFESVTIVNAQGDRLLSAHFSTSIKFYNDGLSPAVTTATVINLFSFVPIRAKHMELIEGNRLAFANITEGYASIETSVALVLSWENLAGITQQVTNWAWAWIEQSDGGVGIDWLNRFTLPTSEPTNNGDIYLRVQMSIGGAWTEIVHPFVNGDLSWPSGVRSALVSLAVAEWGSGEVENTCFGSSTAWEWCMFPRNQASFGHQPPYVYWDVEWYIVSNTVSLVDKYPTLKTGSNHEWGIVYRDIAGRLGPINGANQITNYIPFATESNNYSVGSRPNLEFQINHLPPNWAESWEIVYAGNKSMNYFLHAHVYNWAYGKRDHDDSADIVGYDPDNRSFRVRIKASFSNTRTNLPGWSVEEYFWQKGDRIRIFGIVDQSTGAVDETPFEPTAYIYDAEITAVFTDVDLGSTIGEDPAATEFQYEWIYFNVDEESPLQPTYTSGSATNKFPNNLFIEIYRPFTVETGLFFTTGMTYPIGIDVNGNKFHHGDDGLTSRYQVLTAQGVPSVVAQVTNTSHDAWKYLRSFRTQPEDTDVTIAIWSESQYASDFNTQQILNSRGFPIPFIASAQQNVLTKRLRHGGSIAIGSQVNNLSAFDFDDFLDLKDADGPIEGIREVGFTLKAIQYTRVISIYISRQESFTAAGDAQYLFTDKVFGSTRPSLNSWGSSHPNSVIVDNRHIWFWDQSEGIVVRDAPNGQVAISENKMKRYFTDKAREQDVINKDRQVATMAYSMESEEVFIMFSNADSTTGTDEITVMNETDQRWKSKIDLAYHHGQFYWVGKRLFHLKDLGTNLYEWWRGTDYLIIAGTRRTGSLGFYATGAPQKVKTFDAVHVYQTNQIPIFSNVNVPVKASEVGTEMVTQILSANIKEREGVYYCEILRDTNTPEAVPTSENNRLVNGRRLRGLYVYVEMQFTEIAVPVTLSNIAVVTTPSERSK